MFRILTKDENKFFFCFFVFLFLQKYFSYISVQLLNLSDIFASNLNMFTSCP